MHFKFNQTYLRHYCLLLLRSLLIVQMHFQKQQSFGYSYFLSSTGSVVEDPKMKNILYIRREHSSGWPRFLHFHFSVFFRFLQVFSGAWSPWNFMQRNISPWNISPSTTTISIDQCSVIFIRISITQSKRFFFHLTF